MTNSAIAIVSTLVAVQLMLLAPPAEADNSSFVAEAKGLGFQQETDNLISTARSACYFLSRNRDPVQVTERISRYLAVDANLATRFFAMSIDEYCPQFRNVVPA